MPSPVASTAAPPPQSHEQSQQESTPAAHDAQNGAAGDDATESQDPARPSSSGQTADGNGTIRETKEKAKALMAASGVDVNASTEQASPSARAKSSPGSDAANGVSPSRKRSRSGSRLPSHAPSQGSSNQNPSALTDFLINQYCTRDLLHAAAMNDQAAKARGLMTEKLSEVEYYKQLRQQRQIDPGSVFGYGFDGYGNGYTEVKPSRLQYPAQRKRLGNRRSKSLHVPRKDLAKQADTFEELVPVRLDIEFDKIKLRDTFTWNLHDHLVSPELFAENMVEDFKLPPEMGPHVFRQINTEIHEQLQDYYPHVYFNEEPLDPTLPYDAYKNDEMRILIKLNITIGQHTLVDQFEWDINDPMNSPEEFARSMTAELSLSGEFTTAIAHSIREQCQMFTKSLYITGHPFDGRPVEDADVREGFLTSPIQSVFRPVQAAKDYAPVLYELNEADLERAELSIMREQRRQKRSVNRRGGPALPDLKDRQRTVRTMVVSSVLPGAVERVEDSRLYKLSRSASGRGRRTVRDGDSDEESESEESGQESPAPSQIMMMGGTARTRGMRGAASAATVAMRQNLGRSQTPEVTALRQEHHHETRTSRRFGTPREESVAPTPTTPAPERLLVRVKISREKYRRWMQAQSTGRAHEYRQSQPNPVLASAASTPQQQATPTRASMPPPPSPAMQQRSTPGPATPTSNGQQEIRYYHDGRADAPFPQPSQAPPPPPWLAEALRKLHSEHPDSAFEALMRYCAIDTRSQQQIRLDSLQAGATPPSHIKFQWLPRIRCNDCPGKLYTPGPNWTVENFEVHLRNRQHLEAVRRRTASSGGGASS
ncbi:SWI/SNF chromatin-remodeling complex subunit SNF5 [Lasiodiplodia hormozganensis]|uniref:SWI/SNF chromatin-remodeling complex subunit SNF5 n=1 Tax=Lasiodiplodia hormozganensis TaxID=869390 RepID=A0AA39Y0U3_9PEZI|nr:SWI/SNF chromatin-remodeling complex subunit SNF5 [Lasiodiplodia hormozganensis]